MKKQFYCCLLVAALLLSFSPRHSNAADNYWVCGDGQWNSASCWSMGYPPASDDTAHIVHTDTTPLPSNGSPFNIVELNASTPGLGWLVIDATGSWINPMVLSLGTGGNLASKNETVGLFGPGIVNQNSGTNTVSELVLGDGASGSGRYTMWGGSLTAGAEYIGNSGSGYFEQMGGANQVNHNLVLGTAATGNGRFYIDDGNLNVLGNTVVGYSGIGDFSNAGGAHNVAGNLTLGGQPGGRGTYSLSNSGSVAVFGITSVGNVGTGEFYQSSGSHTTSTLSVAGTYYLSGGDIAAGFSDVEGVFNQIDGTHTVAHALSIGGGGQYNLSNTGLVAVTGETSVGNAGTGVFNQTGGAHTTGVLSLGGSNSSSGTYWLGPAAGTLSAGKEVVGWKGTGVFNHTGGTNTTNGDLILGDQSRSSGTYNLLGTGSLFASTEIIGRQGTGVFNQNGGTNTINGYLVLGHQAGSSGEYNHNFMGTGSLFASTEIIGREGTGVFTQANGTNETTDLHLGLISGSHGKYNLGGKGSLSTSYEYIGSIFGGIGVFNHFDGTHTVANGLYLGASGGSHGTYNLVAGNLSAGEEVVGWTGTGLFDQTGGTNTTGTLVLNLSLSFGSSGTYNLRGGTLTAGSVVNKGTFNYSGGSLTGNVTNNNGGHFNLSGGDTRTVVGDFTNNAGATVKTTGTTVVFTGTFTNSGAYISDPSQQFFTDLIINPTGYLVGGVGDSFFISNDFTNNSMNALWGTALARLVFDTGTDMLHNFTLGGLASTDPFSWGILELTDGNILNLLGSTLYVDTLILGSGSDLNLDGITLYYRTLQDNGGHIDYLNGGQLLAQGQTSPIPEPGTWLLLGSGLLGLAAFRKRFARK